jgi:hypothetical protein
VNPRVATVNLAAVPVLEAGCAAAVRVAVAASRSLV